MREITNKFSLYVNKAPDNFFDVVRLRPVKFDLSSLSLNAKRYHLIHLYKQTAYSTLLVVKLHFILASVSVDTQLLK